jgi:Tfp pilus assembly protein PilF
MQMGIDLMQSGQLDAANAVFSYVIQQDKEFAEAWNKRATVLFLMGEFEKSKYNIAQTLALERNHFGALAGLGMVEVHLGNPKAALEAYRRAASINPHLQDVQQAIARLEEKLKGLPA